MDRFPDSTIPMELRAGERIELENRIDMLQQQITAFIANQSDRSNDFYKNRMLPLEQRNEASSSRSHVAMALAIVALALAVVLGCMVLVLHVVR